MESYETLQIELSSRGFIDTPITEKSWCWLNDRGFNHCDIVEIAIDVACGYELSEAIQSNRESV